MSGLAPSSATLKKSASSNKYGSARKNKRSNKPMEIEEHDPFSYDDDVGDLSSYLDTRGSN